MSIERQRAVLQQQLDDIVERIADIKRNRGDRFRSSNLKNKAFVANEAAKAERSIKKG